MSIKIDDHRLIGNFIEINADILSEQINSKLPKWMARFVANKHRRRLLRAAKRLYNAKIVLDRDALSEFFTYVYNNYEGKYGIIKNIIISGNEYDFDMVTNIIIDDDIRYVITITNQKEMQIVCNPSYKTSNGGFNTFKTKLYSSRKEYAEYLDILNSGLREELFKYINEIISQYIKKGTRGYVTDNKT